ncbi:outer membrane lipid asymmetry maintenance protein MlaD [Caulobacter segnis]|uniref:outer membrane lipid asymmetry maintenance protein MlaD n=1 Tax=Caulobacter segnis TaxID=88688 RepID=UPI001CBB2355|nr:outer membrane lipid asymmetry maintenance protein MlaD [Caulobacter segnis]UAL10632.1 outer membrane lipid asymmetry maintenance protein MlaD [Caulobacter segnis]
MALREQWAETAMGVVVLALAAGFLTYSLSVGGVHMKRGEYEISAKFGEAGSLSPGAAVSVAGVKVGTVSQITLEPKTYLAVAKLSIDPTVKLPADSTAKITSDGILGGAHVAIAPGASLEDLKPGGEIENTQGAVDLFGLIGSVIRPQGGSGDAAASSTPAPANPATQPAESY